MPVTARTRRLAAALLAAAALAGCARTPHWSRLEHWDHADAHVLGVFESVRPSDSGRHVALDLKPDFSAALAVTYVWKQDGATLAGKWKREEDTLVVSLEGPTDKPGGELRFEWKDDALLNTAWNRDEFGSRGLGELRRK
jgi:hypothetical protein